MALALGTGRRPLRGGLVDYGKPLLIQRNRAWLTEGVWSSAGRRCAGTQGGGSLHSRHRPRQPRSGAKVRYSLFVLGFCSCALQLFSEDARATSPTRQEELVVWVLGQLRVVGVGAARVVPRET